MHTGNNLPYDTTHQLTFLPKKKLILADSVHRQNEKRALIKLDQ